MNRITAVLIACAAFAAITLPAAPASAEEAWRACVEHNLTTPGRGSDADMFACDAAYVATTGQPADGLHM